MAKTSSKKGIISDCARYNFRLFRALKFHVISDSEGRFIFPPSIRAGTCNASLGPATDPKLKHNVALQ